MGILRRVPPWVWILLCVLYILSPLDLIPDFFGLPGRLDDLALAIWTFYFLRSGWRPPGGGRKAGRSRTSSKTEGSTGPDTSGRAPQDPYEVLGVKRGQDLSEIRARYRELLLRYHPDRVEHLGEEFRELAERRTRQITEAFQRIMKEGRRRGRSGG